MVNLSEQLEKINISHQFSGEAKLSIHAAKSVGGGLTHNSRLPDFIANSLPINGFCGKSFRHFMNNLGALVGVNYLEVGSFCGASLISTLWGNFETVNKAYAIDDWSIPNEFIDVRNTFFENFDKYLPEELKQRVTIIEDDCFSVDLSLIKEKINLYYYDAGHEFIDQKRAFTYFNDVFDDVFIAIIDDWKSDKVRAATLEAFSELKYKTIAKWEITPKCDEEETWTKNPDPDWWHGTCIVVLKK